MVTKQFQLKIIFEFNKNHQMKKHIYRLLFICISTLSFTVSAQVEFHSVKEISARDIQQPAAVTRLFYDTLTPSSQDSLGFGFCGDTLKIYELNLPAHGYIGGNNSNGDKEIMQKFGVTGSGGVYTILALFGKKSNTTNALITAKMYSVDPLTHGPDSFMQVTDPLTLADIDTNSFSGLFTTFPYPGVIYCNDSFFAAIELPTTQGDTIAVYMTPQNCYSGDQQAYVLKSNGNFVALGSSAGYSLNADYWIWPVFIPDSSVGNSAISLRDLSLFRAYPNPAVNSVSVNFSIRNFADVWIDFVDDLGRIVKTVKSGNQLPGMHSINVDISDLPSANYYYSIVTPHERLFSRISVMHD